MRETCFTGYFLVLRSILSGPNPGSQAAAVAVAEYVRVVVLIAVGNARVGQRPASPAGGACAARSSLGRLAYASCWTELARHPPHSLPPLLRLPSGSLLSPRTRIRGHHHSTAVVLVLVSSLAPWLVWTRGHSSHGRFLPVVALARHIPRRYPLFASPPSISSCSSGPADTGSAHEWPDRAYLAGSPTPLPAPSRRAPTRPSRGSATTASLPWFSAAAQCHWRTRTALAPSLRSVPSCRYMSQL